MKRRIISGTSDMHHNPNRYLLFDDPFTNSKKGVLFQLEPPRSRCEPVILPDQPWEERMFGDSKTHSGFLLIARMDNSLYGGLLKFRLQIGLLLIV